MHYSTLISLALATAKTTQASDPHSSLSIPPNSRWSNRHGRGGHNTFRFHNRAINKLPVAAPVFDRINVPGRPKWSGQGNSASSPEYPYLFAAPLPIPEVAKPIFTEVVNDVPIDYYEMTIESFDTQLFPDRGPTTLIG
jgi:hypothetical protein